MTPVGRPPTASSDAWVATPPSQAHEDGPVTRLDLPAMRGNGNLPPPTPAGAAAADGAAAVPRGPRGPMTATINHLLDLSAMRRQPTPPRPPPPPADGVGAVAEASMPRETGEPMKEMKETSEDPREKVDRIGSGYSRIPLAAGTLRIVTTPAAGCHLAWTGASGGCSFTGRRRGDASPPSQGT
ncbi:sterile alpha motif domain-containing protein 1-like [Hemicordylus capensis]|uniref:sterile alpha motif domain-containing protein 1-like n=1 Tax=Hemicordylus capensis TaxID=884348 RepID=UPI0023034AB1|nr:sterile alpha motif domain-containing protein 1-like [Hemicordylus capensis]